MIDSETGMISHQDTKARKIQFFASFGDPRETEKPALGGLTC